MPERAEIEAGWEWEITFTLAPGYGFDDVTELYEAIEGSKCVSGAALSAADPALDRVRDARGDNNGRCRTCGDWVGPDGCERCARSPQGEDHEAEAVAALYEFARERWGWGSEEYESVRDAVAVVLARVSPSRDGTVAIEHPEPDALGGLPPSQPKEDQR